MVSSSRPAACGPASNHTACSITPDLGASRLTAPLRRFDDAVTQRRRIEPDNVHPLQTVRRRNRPGLYDLQAPLARLPCRNDTQPQCIVMIEHRLQGRNQFSLLHALRQAQQHRLVEVFDRAAPLYEPMHDRRRRQRSDGDVGRLLTFVSCASCAVAAKASTV